MIFRIETGHDSHLMYFGGRTPLTRAVRFFRNYPPENPGILTRIREEVGKKKSPWVYIDTTVLLKKAGYEVEN